MPIAFRARRRLIKSAAILAALPAQQVGAQEFPARPVTIIVPAPPGGLLDTAMRVAARLASPHLGDQSIVIDNRPGASLLLGADAMAKIDRGDGYLLAQSTSTWMRMPHLRAVNYDAQRDFTFIISMAASPFGVAVRTESPWKSFNDVLAAARARPGQVSYGTVGIGNAGHLLMEEIARLSGVKWNLIAMKGSTEIIQAVLGGHVDLMSDSTSWAPQVASGKMRLLMHYGETRLKKFPDVPVARELGMPITYLSPFGLAGPRNMDPKVVKILHDAFQKAMEHKDYQDMLERFELVPLYMNSARMTADMKETYERERAMIARMGLTGKL
jgi:tripartite-type tricarboxylate transporter receptor subunit TctC